MNCRDLYEKVKSEKLDKAYLDEVFANEDLTNTRIQCLKSLMNTEHNYLTKIQDLLMTLYNIFEKFSIRPVISKSHLAFFYQHFPILFNFHKRLQEDLLNEIKSSQLIGRTFIKFLNNSVLINTYLNYVSYISDYLNLCQQMKMNESWIKHSKQFATESIIMMPIQRFPQLQLVLNDIYINTNDNHKDKVNLYKSICLIKSLSMRLDQRQKNIESNEINEICCFMKRLKINFKSKRIITKKSVYYLKPDFNIPRKLVKLPYHMILCDKEIIMYPKDMYTIEIPFDMIIYYSLAEVDIQIKNIIRFKDQKNSTVEFHRAQELFSFIKDSFISNRIIREIEEILNDYNIVAKIYDEVGYLNFRYDCLEQLKISRILLKLEKTLSQKERELNHYFDSLLNLKIVKSNSLEDSKLFLFDSSREANHWKTNFFRTKLILNLNICQNWIQIPKICHMDSNIVQEFPISFPPYSIDENGIINIKCKVVKCQPITIVIETKIDRCLWLSLTNGFVIILHFNYKNWSVLESFQMNISEPIECLESVVSFDPNIADIALDTEMWMSLKDEIISHSLERNKCSLENFRLKLPSEISTMSHIDNKMFIGLKSLNVSVYSQGFSSNWNLESMICLKDLFSSDNEIIWKIVPGEENILYFVFKKQVLTYDISKEQESPKQIFTSQNDIVCFEFYPEGIWITTDNDLSLNMYDKNLKLLLQHLTIPTSSLGIYKFNSVTSILITNKYFWIGTDNGLIIIISTVDRLSNIDSTTPMYLNSKFSSSSINILLKFQNIHSMTVKSNCEETKERNIFSNLKRSQSFPSKLDDSNKNSNYFLDEFLNGHQFLDTVDKSNINVNKQCFEDIKNRTPIIILTIVNGIHHMSKIKKCNFLNPAECLMLNNEQCVFSFLE